MLAKSQRLRSGRDIERVYRQGRYGGSQLLNIKVLRHPNYSSRAVVVVGKKISKKAVIRNRQRRRLSELLSKDWQQILPGCDIVVTVKTDVSATPVVQLESDLLAALKRAGATK